MNFDMPVLYVVFGNSGSGKDTVGNYLGMTSNATGVKWAALGKRELEKKYGLPYGTMEDRVARLAIEPSSGKTYLDLLIESWERCAHSPTGNLWTAQTSAKLDILSSRNEHVVITDTRSPDEGEAVIDLVKRKRFELKLIWVNRRLSQKLASDEYQIQIFESLIPFATDHCFLHNESSRAMLYNMVDLHFKGRVTTKRVGV